MATGFERRDEVQDPLARSRIQGPDSIPLTPVMSPRPSSFSRVGENGRKLAEALGQGADLLNQYKKKKEDEWTLEGKMAYAEGKTEEEIRASGNRYTTEGFMAMKAKVAGDELYANEIEAIKSQNYSADSKSYQEGLSQRFKEMSDRVGNDPIAREMLAAQAADVFPKLVAEQVRANNEWRKEETMKSTRGVIVSTAMTDGPDAAADMLRNGGTFGLGPKDFETSLAAALSDAYDLGSDAVEKALIARDTPAGAVAPAPRTVDNPKLVQNLQNLIGAAESKNSYTAVWSGENPKLTSMTVDEVLAYQSERIAAGTHSASGKYQIKKSTLEGLKAQMGLTGTEVYDAELQDKMAAALMKGRGLDDYLAGKIQPQEFMQRLSMEWAGLPKDQSGNSYYHGDGINRATVQPGAVMAALNADVGSIDLYNTLSKSGMSGENMSKILKAREKFQIEQSSKFEASRLLAEKDLVEAAVNLSDEELFKRINDTKKAGNYSDQWGNGVWDAAQTARKKALEENKKVQKVQTAIAMNSVKQLSSDEQQKAIDMVSQTAIKMFPDALDPSSPNQSTAKRQAQDEVFKFMDNNQITDERLKTAWEVATTGDIVDGNGKVKPAALDAYSSYLQAKTSTNNPLFAATLLTDKTSDLFLLADSYRTENDGADAEQALITASAFMQKQEMSKNTMALPWWKDMNLSIGVTHKLQDSTLPGLFNGFFGLSRKQAQMRWSLNEESVQAAAKSSDVTDRIKFEAAKIWNTTKHWQDQDAARELALAKATNKVMTNSEYVAGSFVYTGDQPSIAERIGMGGVKNAANMVTSRIMGELGPQIWDGYNSTDIYSHSQKWYVSEPGIEKVLSGALDIAGQTIGSPIDTIGNVVEKAQQKVRGVPDFQVTMNPSGNAMVLTPYTNFERTKMGQPFILSVEKMKEAAALLNKGDEAGFKKWAEEQKASLPKYKW